LKITERGGAEPRQQKNREGQRRARRRLLWQVVRAILNNGATVPNASRENRSGATDGEENDRRARRRHKRRDFSE